MCSEVEVVDADAVSVIAESGEKLAIEVDDAAEAGGIAIHL